MCFSFVYTLLLYSFILFTVSSVCDMDPESEIKFELNLGLEDNRDLFSM